MALNRGWTGALILVLVGATAYAQPNAHPPSHDQQAAAQAPQLPQPGPQDRAIAPLFSGTGTWTGNVPAGAMAPDSKAMTSSGKSMCRPILNNLWYTCDIQDQMGSPAQTFRGHLVVGYDRGIDAYRAVMVDNLGTSLTELHGTLNGKKLVLETPNATPMMGKVMKDRLTFDFTDPKNVRFTDEHQPAGSQSWQLFEQGTIHTQGASPQARTPGRP